MASTGRLHLITSKRWEIIEEGTERFKNVAERFQKVLIEPLANSDFETAFRQVSGFYSTYQFPVGIGTNGADCLR
jgi:hypothetical protein